jgi:hypothetical protein
MTWIMWVAVYLFVGAMAAGAIALMATKYDADEDDRSNAMMVCFLAWPVVMAFLFGWSTSAAAWRLLSIIEKYHDRGAK